MKPSLTRLLIAVVVLIVMTPLAFAQGASSTASLTGTVVDKDGGMIPGATVVAKNNATTVSQTTVTNNAGVFSFPTLDAGVYTVTVTLQGFKTAVVTDVRLLAATPASLKTTLEIGGINETVEVRGGTELVRTQSPTVSSTISSSMISSLPVLTRNALNFLIFLPGVQTIGGSGNARSSTISGLPQNTINITIDGVNNSNNLQSGDGFFSMVVPRLDAVEEVTISTATAGADSSGQGATQIRFQTKSGTNTFNSSFYEYFRHKSLNSNTFVNQILNGLPRPRTTIDTYGGRIGGPIVLPGLFDGHNKAFFFFNQEEVWQPNEVRRNRTVITSEAQAGNFTYNLSNPTTVNVLQIAAANGQLASVDPTVAALLDQIRAAVGKTGTLSSVATSPNTQAYAWLSPTTGVRHSPTGSFDLNLSAKNHFKGTYYWQRFNDNPDTLNSADPVFPGFPVHAHQASYRTNGSATLRTTLSPNVVNEVLSGWQWSPVDFFADLTPSMFENQGGYNLSLGFGLSGVTPGNFGNAPEWRDTPNWNIDDNLHWLKGNHNFGFGFSYTQVRDVLDDWNTVPNVNLGFNTTNDPAASLFATGSSFFPGANSTDLGSARALYALLTGRISSMPGTARLSSDGQYIYQGHLKTRERLNEYGAYAQDTWRLRPNVTLIAGLRYELQLPMKAITGNYAMSDLESLCGVSGLGSGPGGRQCSLFTPGVFGNPGAVPTYRKYNPGSPGYDVDYNNVAPNVGIAWRPSVKNNFGRKFLGDPEQATVTAGFTRAYNRERMDRFINLLGGNPGGEISATRGTNAGNYPLVFPGESWPILLREKSRLGAPAFPPTPTYPQTASINSGDDINIFDPRLQTPYTDSWTVGLQRSVSRDMAVEVRYIGNRNKQAWTTENWNVVNIRENGFLDEFKLAQANLRANAAAGRGATFAYFGPGSGTSPLPTFLAGFTGSRDASNPAVYTSAFSGGASCGTGNNATPYLNNLDQYSPSPYGAASCLWTGNSGTWRNNLAAAGVARNFFVLNPQVDQANMLRAVGGGHYHSLQVDLRRRLSHGLQVTGSYTWARQWALTLPNNDYHYDRFDLQSANVPHAFKMLWVWDLPVGRGKRYGTDMNKWLDGLAGGWQFSGSGRVQLQNFRLQNTKLVGMSFKDAQAAFKQIRIVTNPTTGVVTVFDMPQDIIDNTRKAYSSDLSQVSGYPAGQEPTGRYFAPVSSWDCRALRPGDCGQPDLFFYGPWFGEFDFKFVKRFPLPGRAVAEMDVEVFNALNGTNFTPQLNPGGGANIFRITAQGSGARVGQLVWRVTF